MLLLRFVNNGQFVGKRRRGICTNNIWKINAPGEVKRAVEVCTFELAQLGKKFAVEGASSKSFEIFTIRLDSFQSFFRLLNLVLDSLALFRFGGVLIKS